MGQPEAFDDLQKKDAEIDQTSDIYTSGTSSDVYNMPDPASGQTQAVQDAETAEAVEAAGQAGITESDRMPEITEAADMAETADLMSAVQGEKTAESTLLAEDVDSQAGQMQSCDLYKDQNHDSSPYDNSYCGNQPARNNDSYAGHIYENRQAQEDSPYVDNPYRNQQVQGVGSHSNNPYGVQQARGDGLYGNNPYGNQQTQDGGSYSNNPYGSQQMQDGGSYSNNPYGSQQIQGADPYNNNPYGNQQTQGTNSYGNNPCGNQQARGGSPYSSNPYGNQQMQGGSPYNQNFYGYQQDGNPCSNGQYGGQPAQGGNMYGNNPYSPYAVPSKKNNTGLIIGIIAGIIILFLIAVFALTYKVVSLYSEDRDKARNDYEEYEFNDDREINREKRREENDIDSYGYDDDFYYDYEDGYDYYDDYYDFNYGDDYDYDSDQYYTLHDDIKTNLSYSVDFDYYEYDTDNEDVAIMVTYPVIKGENIPNLEHLNDVIEEETDLFKDYFEEEYADHMDSDDSYFSAISSGYVTYMDEEKLSIVFSEYLYTDYYNEAFLYSINIDMENGVILDNENILSVDDDFSVEFRKRSDIQNGEIVYLTGMTDQEITDYFNSSNIIVFYTPKGMEIGFNYDEGWVTVTYEEYEQYLKVF